jgi:hypothetical protein
MSEQSQKMTYQVEAWRVDARGSRARCMGAEIALDKGFAATSAAFNAAEQLLATVGACMPKGIERVTPILRFWVREVRGVLHDIRQDAPPQMKSSRYEIIAESDAADRRLELPRENVKRFGTVFSTVAPGTALVGVRRRKQPTE